MDNEGRPRVRPSEEIWKLCVSYAEEHDMTPFKVLERFVRVGAMVAEAEKAGGTVFMKKGDMLEQIVVFKNNSKTP